MVTQPPIDRIYFTVKVLLSGKKRWKFIGNGRSTTYLRVHAIQYATLDRADAVADEIMRDNPGVKAKVQPF